MDSTTQNPSVKQALRSLDDQQAAFEGNRTDVGKSVAAPQVATQLF